MTSRQGPSCCCGSPSCRRARPAAKLSVPRVARLIAIAVIAGVGISQVVVSVTDWHLSDASAYWDAALRLRAGEQLYPPLADTELSEVYRYAPWFAWVWVPFSHLPRDVVMVGWSAMLLTASALALTPLVRRRAWLAVAFFGFILFGISAIGNAHPLLIAALVLGVERRSGPLWIALAASLKAVPILLVLVYLGRREWRRAATTLALTALLVAPLLFYDLAHYSTEVGAAGLLYRWLPVYVGAVLVGALLTLRLARSRHAWLTAATTLVLATPRFFIYDVSYLLVGAVSRDPRPSAHSDEGGGVQT
jgi:hypothetical protein